MVGRSDKHGVDVVAVDHAPEIFHDVGFVAAHALDDLGGLGGLGLVDVADDGTLDLGVDEERAEIDAADPAAPDEPDADLFTGGHGRRGARLLRHQQGRGGQAESGIPEKIAAGVA